jgi:hypothetical protein
MELTTVKTSDDFQQGGYFPLEFFVEFLQYLKDTKNIEVITYNDLAWDDKQDSETIYEAEKRNWLKQLRTGKRDSNKIYVLLQHDVDSRPERSMQMVHEEMRIGIPSNVMIFCRRHNRKQLKNESTLQYTDYDLDVDLLKKAEQEYGFVIGYHCNAYEQALYNLSIAQERMTKDINELRENYMIKFWSAHGGVPGPEGKNNNKIIPPRQIEENTIWVHNGASPFFDGNYSDGGLNNKKRDPKNRNIRDFVTTWQPGKRYRILTHPQYYNSPPQYNEWLGTAEWYQKMFAVYEKSGKGGWVNPPKNQTKMKTLKSSFRYKTGCLLNYIRARLR